MNDLKFQAEMKYQMAIAIAKTLLEKGLLTRDEYAVINTILLDKYRPTLGTLLSENVLT